VALQGFASNAWHGPGQCQSVLWRKVMYLPVPSFEYLEQFLFHAEIIVLLAGAVAGTAIFILKYIKHRLKE
jgi:hypothetical protein